MRTNLLTTALTAAIVFAASCGSTGMPDREVAAPAGSASTTSGIAGASGEANAAWEAILADPGVPGVDYDPGYLTVSYVEGAVLPARLRAMPQAAGDRAAEQSNAIIRKDKSYEQISDSIAARFGLKIEGQVYMSPLLTAGFALPEGADGDAIIAAILRDYQGVVEYVTYSRQMYARYTPNDPNFNSSSSTTGGQWGLKRIGCEAAWDITRGSSDVQIAVVDSGVRLSHEEFVNSNVLVPEEAFPGQELDVRNGDNTVEDTNGHGTFIAGLVGAETDNNQTIASVAHNCEVIPIKIANGGVTPDFRMFDGVALAVALGAEVVNLSWGGPGDTQNLRDLVDLCEEAGVVFVCAAGNDNTDAEDFPGAYSYSICVGATFINDERCWFSNFGDYVDIAAPGEALRSCASDSNSSYLTSQGTSFSAPIVAAAAGLLLSIDPTLTPQQVRDVLLGTAVPTTGFSETVPVGRLDLAAAVEQIAKVEVQSPKLTNLIHSGTVALSPVVIGKPNRVEMRVGGVPVQTLFAAPFDFSLDTSATAFGVIGVDFVAFRGETQSSAHLDILAENLPATFPVQDSFEAPPSSFAGLDLKRGYDASLLNQLILLPSSDWTEKKLADNGPGQWRTVANGSFDGGFHSFCGTATLSHGAYELDCLISRKVNLTQVENSSLVFYEKHNLEDGGTGLDRAYVLASTDGAAWEQLHQKGSSSDFHVTGSMLDWTKRELDLSSFDGSQVYIAFVMATDGNGAAGQSGFWLDKVTIASDYNQDIATIGGVNLTPYSVYGEVPSLKDFDLAVSQPINVARVEYVLDFAPLGVMDSYDEVLAIDTAPFNGLLSLPAPDSDHHNQLALMVVRYFDAANVPGPEMSVPVYIFNQRGDTTADGLVNQADLDAYAGKVGLSTGDPGYVPFFDSDLDGTITESDAAAVGYFFGASL